MASDGPDRGYVPPEGRPPPGASPAPPPPPPPPARNPGPARPPARVPSEGGRVGPVGAGLGPRVGARLLDLLVVAIPLSIVLSLVGWGAGAPLSPGRATGQVSSVLYALLWFGYFVWFESSRGATLGKSLLGIQVQGPQGGLPSTERVMKRNVWMLLGLIPWVGGLLWFAAVVIIMITIATGSNMQGLHDEWAGTAVLRI